MKRSIRPPDPIQAAGQEKLAAAGFDQYEISAYAQDGHRCRHNLNYWSFGDYLAAGAGAHGKLTGPESGICRYRKPAHPQTYMESVEAMDQATGRRAVPASDIGFEFMLNALRLTDGFSRIHYESRTGQPMSTLGNKLDQAIRDGLMESAGKDRWRPTSRGFRFLNDLQARFLPS